MNEDPKKPVVQPVPRYLSYGILLLGNCVLIGTLVLFIILAERQPHPYSQTWKLVLANVFGGRAANCAIGLDPTLNFNRGFLLFQVVIIDFIVMLIAYGLFIGNFHRLASLPLVGRPLVSAHEMAMRHKDRVAKYGAPGLLIFVVFPLWSTGPLVGAIVGFILGLPTWLTFTVVTLGNTVTTVVWIWFFHFLSSFGQGLGWFMLMGIVVITVALTIYRNVSGWWRRRQLRKVEAAARARERELATAGHLDVSSLNKLNLRDVPGATRAGTRQPSEDQPKLVTEPVTPAPGKTLHRLRQTIRQVREQRRAKTAGRQNAPRVPRKRPPNR